MTTSQTKLFVILDPEAKHQVALVKALLIAKLGNCRIHAFLCLDDTGGGDADASRQDQSLADARQWLADD